ncbi:uncharacterized protein LAESUDRAFT_625247, partial [Laetiporus sulphureus 93-53]
IQSTYWLEPTNSHGVCGLDDSGLQDFWVALSSGITGHKYIKLKAIHDSEIVDEHAKHCMYFACIKFVNSVGRTTTASLWLHSPMLDDIS